MRFIVRAAASCAVAAVVVASCSVPTDKAQDIQVTVQLSDSLVAHGVLGPGEREAVFASAFRLGPTGDTVTLSNVDFQWSSSDPSVLTVERQSGGEAVVTGVTTGTATVKAEASAFAEASAGLAPIRVAPGFVIDSIRPTSVRYGQMVTVYGVRIANLFALEQGFADLIPDAFSLSGSLVGLSSEQYWVPYPAFSARPFYIGPGFFGTAADSITVNPVDLYEPDSSAPTVINLDGPGGPRTFFGLPTLFYNPALFFEPDTINFQGTDWFHFDHSDPTAAVSFTLSSTVFGDTAYTYFADSIDYLGGGSYFPTDAVFNPGSEYYCNGFSQVFFTGGARSVSPVFAFTHIPAKSQILSFYRKPGRYVLVAVRGYLNIDRLVGPDRFEDDDIWCRNVDSTFTQSNDSTSPNRKHIVIGMPLFQNGAWFDSTLTIDNPGDADFIRFRVQPTIFGSDTSVTIVIKPRPFGGVNFSDIDVFVFRQSDFAFMGASQAAGSNEQLTVTLPAGDYYLAVVDVGQQPTRYAICMVKNVAACTPPGSAPPAAIAAAVLRRPSRVGRDPRQPPAGFQSPFRRSPSPPR